MVVQPERQEAVEGLAIELYGERIGVLVHYAGGRNILTFDPAYVEGVANDPSRRPTATLTQQVSERYLQSPKMASQRLPPLLSNLLPEGALRAWMADALKTHPDNEFPLLAVAGQNLPGAFVAHPLTQGRIPSWALSSRERVQPIQINVRGPGQRFSLAGVQMKFSARRRDQRFNITAEAGGDDWIIKTPSSVHRQVPANEYTAMRLAEAVGVDIPDIELIPLEQLGNLPDIQLGEGEAYAIKRFDRSPGGRVHAEDFAQVFECFAHDKYGAANYEQVGRALYRYGEDGLAQVQQMARRLLVNILLANGDAHLKNWSLVYPDRYHARLSPAYDIVTTLAYVEGEADAALNMAGIRRWQGMSLAHFRTWAERIGVSWPAIRVHLEAVMAQARSEWPDRLADLPMAATHKALLRQHWQNLHNDFRLD
ncbi:type II toxin-antitoxin system HipA family toxin [Marinobacter sp. JSM 1782161]|uniref:type II toxin-antitoxin system HipA family toxin n=1 Tax=Marinobacter sp. JSM 1782161 TaxID=2685906 RepID=UPI001401BFF0|nr:type II toxin-antitoxin system HipA family toxin [Marinobacter sp. JSM 1782161]